MNYRHVYHAGNHADVFKHAVLMAILGHLLQKPKPFFVLDTHAGIGAYDLRSAEAMKTGEAGEGIGKVLSGVAPEAEALLAIVRAMNPVGELAIYPGSPAIVQRMLRPDDRLVACELHPEDYDTLRRQLRGDTRVAVQHRDGYEALLALVPPKERRGLVLIDPPFEAVGETSRLADRLVAAWRKWSTGIYVAWFPIKDRRTLRPLFRGLAEGGLGEAMVAEFIRFPEDGLRLSGSGMVIVNPPWQLDRMVTALAHELAVLFGAPVQAAPVRTVSAC